MTTTTTQDGAVTFKAPDTRELKAELDQDVAAVRALAVIDVPTHRRGQELLKLLVGRERAIREKLDPIIASANRTHKQLTAIRAELLQPLDLARAEANCKCFEYESAERLKAEERARELAEAARRQEEERQLADAIEAEQRGDQAGADQILAEPPAAPVVSVEPQVARVEGVVNRTTWRAEVTDLPALVRYVAQHPEWIHLIEPAMAQLNALARSQREALRIPGVLARKEEGKAVRA